MQLNDKDFTRGGFGCLEGKPLIAIRIDADYNQVKNDIIQSMKIKGVTEKRIKEIKTLFEEKEDIDWATDKNLGVLDKALSIYESLLEESK